MRKLIVTNQSGLSNLDLPGVEIISPKTYFTDATYSTLKRVKVFNLCRDYSYQSKGYYVSLLAEARGHKPIPDVKNLQDLKHSIIIKSLTDDLDDVIQRSMSKIRSETFELSVYFGYNIARHYDKLCKELHRIFPVPLFRVRFVYSGKWLVHSIKPIAMREVPEHHLDFLEDSARIYFDQKTYGKSKNANTPFDLAILIDPSEHAPPSNAKALVKFKQIAQKHGFYPTVITRDDANRLNEFDALFLRATTSVNHYTYRMARTAESEGIAVIDDPSSILKCANKVYLAELLHNAKIDTPKTMIIHSDNRKEIVENLGLPCILKLPDSSFSHGVIKVSTKEELDLEVKKMLDRSELLIGQAYLPTDFDWRIGIIDGKAFYACKYYMARGHWQIYNWKSTSKSNIEGNFDCVPMEEVPSFIVESAEKSAGLIGSGLYGVDLKEVDGKAIVIEVNDNPNIDYGIEDQVLKDEVYDRIILYLKRKVMDRVAKEKF